MEKLKILLFEDDEDCSFIITRLLSKNFLLDHSDTAEAGLTLAKNTVYDLILMDIGLKDVNGMDIVKKLRSMKHYENTPIVALTAFAMFGDKEKFLEGGCTHYLSKPFLSYELIETVNSALKV
ncbi:MAG: response regulator [Ignavibacteria bacterium]|nr:response regulator [Ignavibacteria bacterium]